PVPDLSAFGAQLAGSGDREISTTMAFVRILNTLLRDKEIGERVVPIVPDESRTFGMEGMFRQFGIFSQVGQLYQPEDANQLMYYRQDQPGQILQHQDGHSHVFSSVIPNCVSYDPTFAYELAVIVQDGLRRMYVDQEDVFYYLTLMNENYGHPQMPEGVEDGIRRGMYLFSTA